jgi:hypothetical protein
MAQPARVKKQLEAAAKVKVQAASQTEARQSIATWDILCGDPEATADLRSIGVFYRDALSAAVVNENAAAQEAALSALTAIAQRYQ